MSRYENSKELVPVKIEPDEYQERLLGLSQSSLKTTASDYAYTHKFRVSEDSLNLALRIVTSTFLTHLHENGIQPRSQAEVTKLIRESLKERGKWITQANRMVDGLSNQNRVDKLGIEYSKLHRSKDELKNSSRQIEFPQTQELIKLTKTRAEMLPQLANSIIDFELRGQDEGEVKRVKRIISGEEKQATTLRGWVASYLITERRLGEDDRQSPFLIDDQGISILEEIVMDVKSRYRESQPSEENKEDRYKFFNNFVANKAQEIVAGMIRAKVIPAEDLHRQAIESMVGGYTKQVLVKILNWMRSPHHDQLQKAELTANEFSQYYQKKYEILGGLPIVSLVAGVQFEFDQKNIYQAEENNIPHLWQSIVDVDGELIADQESIRKGYLIILLLESQHQKLGDKELGIRRRLFRGMDEWSKYQKEKGALERRVTQQKEVVTRYLPNAQEDEQNETTETKARRLPYKIKNLELRVRRFESIREDQKHNVKFVAKEGVRQDAPLEEVMQVNKSEIVDLLQIRQDISYRLTEQSVIDAERQLKEPSFRAIRDTSVLLGKHLDGREIDYSQPVELDKQLAIVEALLDETKRHSLAIPTDFMVISQGVITRLKSQWEPIASTLSDNDKLVLRNMGSEMFSDTSTRRLARDWLVRDLYRCQGLLKAQKRSLEQRAKLDKVQMGLKKWQYQYDIQTPPEEVVEAFEELGYTAEKLLYGDVNMILDKRHVAVGLTTFVQAETLSELYLRKGRVTFSISKEDGWQLASYVAKTKLPKEDHSERDLRRRVFIEHVEKFSNNPLLPLPSKTGTTIPLGELFERLNPRLDTVRAFCEIESLQKEIKLKRQERIQLRVKIGRAQAVDRVVDAQEQIAQCEKSLETLTEEFINSMSRLRLVLEREGREE